MEETKEEVTKNVCRTCKKSSLYGHVCVYEIDGEETFVWCPTCENDNKG